MSGEGAVLTVLIGAAAITLLLLTWWRIHRRLWAEIERGWDEADDARAQHRVQLDALTPDDWDWLRANNWNPSIRS